MAVSAQMRRHGVRTAVFTAVAALSLTACSASGDDTAPAATSEAGAASGVVEGEDLAVAAVSAPNSLDPAQLADGQQALVWGSIFDTLLVRENGSGELKPNAAESWEYSEDGRSLTLTLREGMTFSDGDPVTADAVVATMQRTMETPGNQQGNFRGVTSITAPDERTVVIAFEEYQPQFLPYLATGAGVIADPDTVDTERTALDPIGSGPYVLNTDQTVPGTSYVLDRRDDYWNVEGYPFETVTVRVLQDPQAAFNAFQAGEIDAVTVRPQQIPAVEGIDGAQLTEIQASNLAVLNILDRAGEKFEALGDARVRQAISMSIDREGIVESLLQGEGEATQQVVGPYGEIYDEELNETFEYDPEAARALLEEAGYGDGVTLQIPSTFITTAFEPTLTQQLGEIGITLEWVPVPPQQAQSATQSGEYGLAYQVFGLNAEERDVNQFYGPEGFANPLRYTDERIEELWTQIRATPNLEETLPAFRELNEYGTQQALAVPIAYLASTVATQDGVTYLDDGSNGIPTVRLYGFSAE
jgi:peptide/nickel transport system substrate-binding protein